MEKALRGERRLEQLITVADHDRQSDEMRGHRLTDWTATYRDMLESFQLIQPNSGKMCDSCDQNN